MGRISVLLVRLVLPSQLLFVVGFLLAGVVQPPTYSPRDDDISDLGALTAHHPWLELLPSLLAGLITISFALGVLRRLVGGPGPVLLALSLVGLDNVTDPFFRLDCGRAVAGCSEAARLASWHAHVHAAVGIVSAIGTVAAFVALSRRFRALPAWQDLARPTQAFAVLFLAVLVGYGALAERPGGGVVQRGAVLLLVGAVAVLAVRAGRVLGTTFRAEDVSVTRS